MKTVPQLPPQPWNMNLPFQCVFAGSAAPKLAVFLVAGLVTTEPVTKQYSGAPSPSTLAGTYATPPTVFGISREPMLGTSPITIPAGAARLNWAAVHSGIAAAAGMIETMAAAIDNPDPNTSATAPRT